MTEREMLEVLLHNVETIGRMSVDKNTRNALAREVEVTKKRIAAFDELESGEIDFEEYLKTIRTENES